MPESTPLITMTVNSFVRYYAMDHAKLITEISRRMNSVGGYDFYRTLNDAIRAHIKGASKDEIDYILKRSSNPSEVNLNRIAFDKYISRFGSKRSVSVFDRKSKLKLCGGKLVLISAPVFEIETKSEFSVYSVWASQSPILDKSKASVGVYLAREAFKKTLPNYSFKLYDAASDKTFGAISNVTASAVSSVASRIVEIASL